MFSLSRYLYVCGLVKYSAGESVENSGPNTKCGQIQQIEARGSSKYVPSFCSEWCSRSSCNQNPPKRKKTPTETPARTQAITSKLQEIATGTPPKQLHNSGHNDHQCGNKPYKASGYYHAMLLRRSILIWALLFISLTLCEPFALNVDSILSKKLQHLRIQLVLYLVNCLFSWSTASPLQPQLVAEQ